MSWLDIITVAVAMLSSLECLAGRIGSMDRRKHRHGVMLGYFAAFAVCILAASLIFQGLEAKWLDLAAWGIAAHLALSWREWRHGAPGWAVREAEGYPRGAVPSRIDGGDRQM